MYRFDVPVFAAFLCAAGAPCCRYALPLFSKTAGKPCVLHQSVFIGRFSLVANREILLSRRGTAMKRMVVLVTLQIGTLRFHPGSPNS